MTIKEKVFFTAQVRYDLKIAKAKVKNLEYVLSLLEEKEQKNETRTSRNQSKYISKERN